MKKRPSLFARLVTLAVAQLLAVDIVDSVLLAIGKVLAGSLPPRQLLPVVAEDVALRIVGDETLYLLSEVGNVALFLQLHSNGGTLEPAIGYPLDSRFYNRTQIE